MAYTGDDAINVHNKMLAVSEVLRGGAALRLVDTSASTSSTGCFTLASLRPGDTLAVHDAASLAPVARPVVASVTRLDLARHPRAADAAAAARAALLALGVVSAARLFQRA